MSIYAYYNLYLIQDFYPTPLSNVRYLLSRFSHLAKQQIMLRKTIVQIQPFLVFYEFKQTCDLMIFLTCNKPANTSAVQE